MHAPDFPIRCLMVYPKFPATFWGFEFSRRIVGRPGMYPPLGLLTVAALLPKHWEVRLVDLNIEPLGEKDLKWCTVVMLTAMRIQRKSFDEIVQQVHTAGKRVIAGGPFVSSDPEAAPDVDFIIAGEVENYMAEFCMLFEQGHAPRRTQIDTRPEMERAVVPRFDLLKKNGYFNMSVQFSRGCPFKCEFCDIIELYGRKPRIKSAQQMVAELDAIYATGFRGSLFLVDDNFIGNKKAALEMLHVIADWQVGHRYPFNCYTEASVNLADEPLLLEALPKAGFTAVFLGIETPSRESLIETQKFQNLRTELDVSVERITAAGLEVLAGFIVGFDSDDETIFQRQAEFIQRSPISVAMVGILGALPGTQLWRRLEKEGRLFKKYDGDMVDNPPNFVTKMPLEQLNEGYLWLVRQLYEPRAYFDRSFTMLMRVGVARDVRRPWRLSLVGVALRSMTVQGLFRSYRKEYWQFLFKAFRSNWRLMPRAFAKAVIAEHFIRYTRDELTSSFRTSPAVGVLQADMAVAG